MNPIDIDDKELYKNIANNVKKCRQEKKLSQLEFSQNVGFKSVSFYCDCENNKNGKHFNLIHLIKIAKFLKIDINRLLGDYL